MNFIKHNWVTGETITATLLNRIEDAVDYLFKSDYDATISDCDALFEGFLEDEE